MLCWAKSFGYFTAKLQCRQQLVSCWRIQDHPELATGRSYSAVSFLQRGGEKHSYHLQQLSSKYLPKRWWSVLGACGPGAFQHANSEACMFVNKVYLAMWFWLSLALGFLYKSKLPVFLCDPWSFQEMTRNLWQHSRVASLPWILPGPANLVLQWWVMQQQVTHK